MEDGVDRPCGTPLLLGHARRLCVSTTLWDSVRISLRKEPSTAQELGAADRAAALVAMRTIAVPAVRAHSDFFRTAWTVGPAPVDITLQLADTFSRHRIVRLHKELFEKVALMMDESYSFRYGVAYASIDFVARKSAIDSESPVNI